MQHHRGFTLIELLIVVAIIGLLSSVVLASLNAARIKARDTQRLSELQQVRTAIELYANDNRGNYPVGGSYLYNITPVLVPAYMPSAPEDEMRVAPYLYRYYTNDPKRYSLLVDLERDGNGNFCMINVNNGYSGWQGVYPLC